MLPLLLTTYGAVFAAEIVGDKLLYTTGVLAARYSSGPIMVGMAIAFMRVAVAQDSGITDAEIERARQSQPVVTDQDIERAKQKNHSAPKAAMVSFAAIFFSEWGDIGQITAATMAARFSSPFVVWIGAVAAMVTKGILAAFLGAGVRQWIRDRIAPQAIRVGGVSLLLVLGTLSVLETLMGRELF